MEFMESRNVIAAKVKDISLKKERETMKTNKEKFTPGPWVITSGANPKEKNIVAIGSGGPENGHPRVAKTICEDFGDGCNPDIANAHLIAAAPEMYEMLQALAYHAPNRTFEKQVQDLLAKARGEHD